MPKALITGKNSPKAIELSGSVLTGCIFSD